MTAETKKCATRWCRNPRAKNSGHFLKHCWKCRSRRLKEKHPWTYVLNMLRHSARKRNLPFTLTVAEFKGWCEKTGYLEKRGNKPDSLTVDRRDENEGYHLWNIRVLTHAENSAQGGNNLPRAERGAATADTDDLAESLKEEKPVTETEPF